jgi:hypothetical protein
MHLNYHFQYKPIASGFARDLQCYKLHSLHHVCGLVLIAKQILCSPVNNMPQLIAHSCPLKHFLPIVISTSKVSSFYLSYHSFLFQLFVQQCSSQWEWQIKKFFML